jgi:PAS domain S-box-containing protein
MIETTRQVELRRLQDDRERLLQALRVEQARLGEVFRRAPAFLAILRGPRHVFELVNDAYYRIVGRRDLIGRPLAEAIPEAREQGFDAMLDRVLETGDPFIGRAIQFRVQRAPGAPGEERFIDFAYMPLVEADGTRSGVIAHGTDVTDHVLARREIESARDRAGRLQALTARLAAATTLHEVAEVVVEQGVAGTGAATGLLAIRAADEPAGDAADRRSTELVLLRQSGVPDEVRASYERFPLTAPGPAAECVRTGKPIFGETRAEVLARFPEIPHVWESLRTEALATVPLAVAGETVGAMSFTFSTPRTFAAEDREFFLALGSQCAQALERARLFAAERAARAEAEGARLAAERARREADEANRAKSVFLATMSHEIRTPINAIIGYAELIGLGVVGPVTEQQRDFLARLAASSEHLRALVDDVLDLAKIDAGGMTIAREPSLTGGLVASALDLVRPQASVKGVRLIDTRPGDGGEPFVGDEHRVRQILANLLSNAVKFTDAGGMVTISCGSTDETPAATELRGSGPWTFIEVVDTGIGIPPREQARVFDPFHQVDRSHTRPQGGTGLGLAISRRLARLMGGDLTLESTPGVGSTFTLWLPAPGASEGVAESAAERGARARQEPGAGRTRGLAEVGAHLRERIEDVIAAFGTRLRADPDFPQAAHLRRSELEDHQLSFLADLAQTLVVVEETGMPESDLLRDGTTIQRVIAELHGAMRQRRGWTDAQLSREYTILGEEIAAAVSRRAADGAEDVSVALDVLGRLIERARALGLAALRRAAEGGRGHDG